MIQGDAGDREQRERGETDGRADQCSWCVSRYTCMRKREFIAAESASPGVREQTGRMRARWKTGQRANNVRAHRDSTEHGHTA